MSGLKKTHLTGCIGEIITFYETLNDQETLYIHEYLMKKWGITDTFRNTGEFPNFPELSRTT